MFSGVGLGEYFAANGLGAGPVVHEISPAMRAAIAQRRMMRAFQSVLHPTAPGPRLTSQLSRPMHGIGEYFAANGLGAGPIIHEISPAMRRQMAKMKRRRQLEAKGIMHGMGEYFAANGLGADDAAPVETDTTKEYAMYAGGGAALGFLAAAMLKKSKLAGTGIGLVLGAGAGYYATRSG
jgi:hypothetical protein